MDDFRSERSNCHAGFGPCTFKCNVINGDVDFIFILCDCILAEMLYFIV